MSELLPDFPPGPLDLYRKKATFDWKKLKIYLEGEEVIQYQNAVVEELKNFPEYHPSQDILTFDEKRHKAARQSFIHRNAETLALPYVLKYPGEHLKLMYQWASSSASKHSVSSFLFAITIRNLGTERHQHYLDEFDYGKMHGCFCLTEIAHGSNSRAIKTTATYNKNTKQFIINTPDFEASKCWVGGLGQCATHCILFAQLVIDGVQYGVHTFIVPLRDTATLTTYPGLTIGDMGEKIGLNGIDNGFILFHNYAVPRKNLLNKTADVTDDGQYVTSIKNSSKRHGTLLGILSSGRVNLTNICVSHGVKALTIAVRYAAVRKQFGPTNEEEVPLLEYQTHQHRLLPYLAAVFVLRPFSSYFAKVHLDVTLKKLTNKHADDLEDIGMEIHGISCASKPLTSWLMRDAIQECREACGGHGYLKVAGIGDVRNDHDATISYEGENTVLIQQTSNWLLKYWPAVLKKQQISSPMQSIDFLSNALVILNRKFTAGAPHEVCTTECLLDAYDWLVCYLLKETYNKLEFSLKSDVDPFCARNESQIFYAKNLTLSFIERFVLQRMIVTINEASDANIKNVLHKLFLLYGLWSLQKHLATFYKGGYMQDGKAVKLIEDAILRLCHHLKDEAVSLVDVIAVPDFVLNSVLGSSDGKVYQRLQAALFSNVNLMSRPSWWNDIVNQEYAKSKL